jgi:hypothetical protein
MNKAVKIFVIVVVSLGILSAIFLLTAKKKPLPKNSTQVSQTKKPIAKPNANPQDQKAKILSQWNQCKNKTMLASTALLWNVFVVEGIPTEGTYAKGYLENNVTLPVRIIVKAETSNTEKIKTLLTVGKTVKLRVNCTDVAQDGAVIVQAF